MTSPQGRRTLPSKADAAALLVCLAACTTRKLAAPPDELDPYEAKPVVTKLASRAGTPEPTDAEKEARATAALQQAESAWRQGDALATLAIVSRAIVDGVPSTMESAFRDLRARARAAVVAQKALRVRLVPEKDAVADGSPARVRLVFTNQSAATVRVPRAEQGTSASLIVVTLTRSDFDVFGNTRSSETTLPAPIQRDLVLDPGGKFESPLDLPAAVTRLTHQGFSLIEMKAVFRPVVLRIGESEFYESVPVEPARVRVFPAGYEQLAEDPLGSLRKAVAKRSPPHILLAAELLAPSDRDAARAVLESAKKDDPPLAQVADAALARIRAGR